MTLRIPTSLPKEKIDEFAALYERKFGESLPEDEAHDTALRLLQFMGIVIQEHSAFRLDDQNGF